jgi:hypothetical protein
MLQASVVIDVEGSEQFADTGGKDVEAEVQVTDFSADLAACVTQGCDFIEPHHGIDEMATECELVDCSAQFGRET